MIGVNMGNTFTYEVEANFEPSLPYNDVKIPSSGEVYPAISFGKIDCAHISSSEKAKKVLNILGTEIENLTNSMAQVARFPNVDMKVKFNIWEKSILRMRQAGGRITDADYASEATKLAKQSLKMGLGFASHVHNTSRLKDVLIPLTTEHFRSKVLSSTL